MEIFGKEVKLNTNVSPKEAKLSLLILSIVVIVGLSAKFIVMPIFEIKRLNGDITKRTEELNNERAKLRKAEDDYSRRYEIFQEQNESYNEEKEKFENSSLKNDTDLKYMIADIAEYLNINIIEVGLMEVSEENEEYIKKFIPYKVEGNISDLGKFLYYLENSNYLISFQGSDLDIQLSGDEGVSVRMEIGAYFNEGRR